MPSVQMHIKDQPEYTFTGNYYTTDVDGKSRFEIQKARQPVEAFQGKEKGDAVTFVSPGGEAEEMILESETATHLIFTSAV